MARRGTATSGNDRVVGPSTTTAEPRATPTSPVGAAISTRRKRSWSGPSARFGSPASWNGGVTLTCVRAAVGVQATPGALVPRYQTTCMPSTNGTPGPAPRCIATSSPSSAWTPRSTLDVVSSENGTKSMLTWKSLTLGVTRKSDRLGSRSLGATATAHSSGGQRTARRVRSSPRSPATRSSLWTPTPKERRADAQVGAPGSVAKTSRDSGPERRAGSQADSESRPVARARTRRRGGSKPCTPEEVRPRVPIGK